MGDYVEINTLVRLPNEFDIPSLKVGKKITIERERERIVPLHIALLLIDKDWNFHGYCRVNSIETKEQKTVMEVEMISLFNSEEQRLYKQNFVEAGEITGEVK